jgi:hypothetical protein
LRRRSVAVPFARSDAESVQELLAYVDEHVPLDAPGVYDNGG